MKAMVLAAGLGTRLRPYTDNKPKALVEVGGVPMLELVLKKLIRYGFTEVIINVHHFADQIIDFLEANKNFGASVSISDETEQLLETGGGLVKAKWFFDDGKPFLIHNIDILSNIDLSVLYNYHLANNALATLAVKKRDTSRSFLVNRNDELCGWTNHSTGEVIVSRDSMENSEPIAFSAIHVMNPEIFGYITETGKFSITNTYLRLAKDHTIKVYRHDADFWLDMGKAENFDQAKGFITNEYIKAF